MDGDAILVSWDNTNDAQGNINGGQGGSMLIRDTKTAGSQIEVYDGNNGIAPTLDGSLLHQDFGSVM